MKEIKFRPLRLDKKTGKIIVASYMGWRKVKTLDWAEFKLTIVNEYSKMPLDSFVHDHKGRQLFFWTYNPADIPIIRHVPLLMDLDMMDFEGVMQKVSHVYKNVAIQWDEEGPAHYTTRGMDCDGVPTFSHYNADYIATHFEDMNQFEPLTVKMVIFWFGWFLYQLQNCKIE